MISKKNANNDPNYKEKVKLDAQKLAKIRRLKPVLSDRTIRE